MGCVGEKLTAKKSPRLPGRAMSARQLWDVLQPTAGPKSLRSDVDGDARRQTGWIYSEKTDMCCTEYSVIVSEFAVPASSMYVVVH